MRRVDDLTRARPTRRRTSTTRTGSRWTRATRRTTTPAATPSGSSATATRRPRPTSRERSAADPNGPIYGQYIGAGGPQLMIYMLHNKTQPAAERLHRRSTSRSCTARKRSCRQGARPAVPRRHRRAVRPHLRRAAPAARATASSPPRATAASRSSGPSTIDGTIIGTGGAPAPRRPARDHREPRLQGEPVPERRPRRRRHAAAQLRRAVARQRPVHRGLPDGGHAPGLARARSTRATGSASPASTRTRTTPGTRR